MKMKQMNAPQKESDGRFRALLGEQQWMRLPAAVRARFGKRLAGGVSVTYQGHVTEMRMNWAGRCLAQITRLIGSPLPYDVSSVGQPAVVVVTEDIASNGQFWVRQYGRSAGFPQVVYSSKRFAGSTGLEEYIGYGIGMALRIEAADDALYFKSDHYFVSVFGRKIRLPRWLCPGGLAIGHHDLGQGAFLFSLRLRSQLWGELIAQDAVFEDAPS